jgi:hypothetical protein
MTPLEAMRLQIAAAPAETKASLDFVNEEDFTSISSEGDREESSFDQEGADFVKSKHQVQTERQLQRDVMESPRSKNKFKQISKEMLDLQKNNTFEQFLQHVLRKVFSINLPQKIVWRVYLDISDFAKRESKFDQARFFYKLAITTQPYAYQGWLEFSKMEEEIGN